MSLKRLVEEILSYNDYTEERIAEEIGVSKRTIKRIRKGETLDPQYKTIARLLSLYYVIQYQKTNQSERQ